jgi:hypothetical protein
MKRNHLLAILGLSLLVMFLVPGIMPVIGNERGVRAKPPGPTVTITSPSNGATVDGTVTITVEASGTPTIYIDGDSVGTGYTYNWDTTTYVDGSHAIKAKYRKATDTITVTVDNGGTPPPPPGNKQAVVVGISNYKVINDLSYCDDDARDWTAYLKDQGYSVTTLIDSQAKEYAVKQALYNAIEQAGPDGQIAFCSSGHGWLDKRTKRHMLDMYDCEAGENGEDGDITDLELEAIFAGVQASTFIFLDHCYSGGMNEVMHNGIYMTTTCGPNGYGYDMPDYKNGAWTYWFLEAGLVGQHFTTAEDCFTWASANYPFGGKDAPMEFDQYSGDFTF